MSSNKFFTNRDDNTLLNKFEGTFKSNPEIQFFDALVGYFRASGYFSVREHLKNIPNVRILVGINVDNLLKNAQEAGLEFFKNHDKTKEEFLNDIINDIQEAKYNKRTEEGIFEFINDIVSQKIIIKAHPDKKIHAKVYIFYRNIEDKYDKQISVITGSSNLTDAGLGSGSQFNYEFNVEIDNYDDVKYAHNEFELLWADAVNILPVDVGGLKQKTYLQDITPLEMYIKMLIEYFGNRVEYDPYNIELLLPPKFTRLKYQTDAANQGYAMMMKHNGFILADVVGLGKTVVASMIIKKFIYENGTQTKILIVCPPAIEDAWRRAATDFQIDNHLRFITTGSLHKVLDGNNYDFPDAEYYDLVVVDESHKFRNYDTGMYVELHEICKRPRKNAGLEGDTKKKVILVSATPMNNRPQDIENQLYLFQDKRNSTLETVKNLQEYFKPVNDEYKKLSIEKKLNIPKLKSLFGKLRDDIIEPLVIRRTRKDLESGEYQEDLDKQKIKFPILEDPTELYYFLDNNLAKLFADTIEIMAGVDEEGKKLPQALGYYRYGAIKYLINAEDKKTFGNVESISDRLAHIMRLLMVKRLESSFKAFKESLARLQKACQNMIEMFDKDRVFVAPDLDVNKLLADGISYDKIQEKIEEKGGNNREFKADAFDKAFIDLLKEDKDKIDKLLIRWNVVTNDPKLEAFTQGLDDTFFQKNKNKEGKLVIFSEANDTALELTKVMKEKGYKVLAVNAKNRKEVGESIRKNFDANLDERDWKHDYDVIITTEVLAEGVNLHRSNVIINYDVPWNATRLMQRIGRVNRIGSRAKQIYVYNYYPSAEGDVELKLVNNALRKLQAFHTAFGEDNRIFSALEEVGDGKLHGTKIKHEESEVLKYLIELREFKKSNEKWFSHIKKVPNKTRVFRKKEDVKTIPIISEMPLPLANSSLSYLKADNHPGVFCFVSEANNVQELSFLDAAKLFKADMNEKDLKTPTDKHFEQVETAYEFFKSDVVQQNISTNINRKDLSPVENKAITNVSHWLKHAPTDQKKAVLKTVLDKIKAGGFPNKGLPKEINDFMAKEFRLFTQNLIEFYDKLFVEILDRYNFSNTESPIERPNHIIKNPKVILTLSFQ
jgi:superfamily II DNA/RNA helicase